MLTDPQLPMRVLNFYSPKGLSAGMRTPLFLAALCGILPAATPFLTASATPLLSKPPLEASISSCPHACARIIRPLFLRPHMAPAACCRRGRRPSSALSSMRCADVTVSEEWEDLVDWIQKEGGWVSQSLAAGSVRDGERGVYAVEDAAGALAFVPLGCCFAVCEEDSAADEAVGLLAEGAPLRLRLAVKLMLEAKSEGSRLAPYLRSLPSPAAFLDHPMMWTDEQLNLLGDAALADGVRADREEAVRLFEGFDEGKLRGATLEDWLWALLVVGSRTYGRVTDHGATLALEPIIDLVNHARFRRGSKDSGRNCLHSYIEKGASIERSAAAALKDMPEGLRDEGCATLFAVEGLRRGDQVLVSYRDLELGGVLPAAESLRAYGFVSGNPTESPDPADWGFALGSGLLAGDESAARDGLAAMVDDAVKEGQEKEELLQVVLCRFAAKLAGYSVSDYKDMLGRGGERERMAAAYRLSRRIAMGRAAVAMVPPEAVTSKAVRAAALGSEGFMSWFWSAFTKPASPLEEAQASLEKLSPMPGNPKGSGKEEPAKPTKGFGGAGGQVRSKGKGKGKKR